jgi:aquaporin Z
MKYLTEFVGTFLFLLVIALVGPSGTPIAPIAIGCALMVMVYMGGAISGAHYNPAVTLGLASVRKMPASDVIPYILCQLCGGILAFLIGGWLYKSGGIHPGEGVDGSKAFITEVLFTMALVLVVLNVACTKKTAGNSYFGLAIGFTIVVAAAGGGPISGGAFNPAVGISATVADVVFRHTGWSDLWLYIVGPIVGGLIAALIWRLQHPEEATDNAA